MPPSDRRGAALRAFDAHAADFTRLCAADWDGGAALAARDVAALAALAARLARDLSAWAEALRALELAADAPLAPVQAGRWLVEGVFDGVLKPAATRVLGAAIDLALGDPTWEA